MSKNPSGDRDSRRPRGISLGILTGLLGYHLRRAQLATFQHFDHSVSSELTPGQFGVLVVIDTNPGLSQTQLGTALGIDRSTVVAVIDRLEQRGWVLRQAAPHDRRSHALHLSSAGKSLLARLVERVATHERAISSDLSEEERGTLLALLGRLARG